jgi:hypothetical protein
VDLFCLNNLPTSIKRGIHEAIRRVGDRNLNMEMLNMNQFIQVEKLNLEVTSAKLFSTADVTSTKKLDTTITPPISSMYVRSCLVI